MRTSNAVILAIGMLWIGLLAGSASPQSVIGAGVAGTIGLLLAVVLTEAVSRLWRSRKTI